MADDRADDLADERVAYDVTDPGFSLWGAVRLLPRVAGRDAVDVEADIDRWARQVRERVDHSGAIVALHDVFFATAGFRGDAIDYDDPANSFVDDVVRRRRGLPIALSVTLMEVATRAGLTAWGLAFPGHFMAAVLVDDDDADDDSDGPVQRRFAVVDAFSGGHLLGIDEVARRVQLPRSELGELLQPAAASTILRRMLTNLRGSYLRRQLHEPLERVLSRMLLLQKNDPTLLLERADVRRLLLDDDGALVDVDAAVRAAGGDDDVAAAAAALRASIEQRVLH